MIRHALAPIGFGFLGLALTLSAAHAQLPWNQSGLSIQNQSALAWRQMDLFARQAAQQFPDHTREGNAKREAARLECLRRYHLPVIAQPQRY